MIEAEKPEIVIHPPNPLVGLLERLHIRDVSPGGGISAGGKGF